jgi:hypothetical protein
MPPGGIPDIALFVSGRSVTIVWVVRRSPATDAAFSSAERVTLAGSAVSGRATAGDAAD